MEDVPETKEALAVFIKDSPGEPSAKTASNGEGTYRPGALDCWLAHMRIAGLPE